MTHHNLITSVKVLFPNKIDLDVAPGRGFYFSWLHVLDYSENSKLPSACFPSGLDGNY